MAASVPFAVQAQVSFEGSPSKVVTVKPEASTGLDAVYVLESTAGVTMAYRASSATATVQWQRFSKLGGAYAEDVSPSRQGDMLTLTLGAGDMGYIIEDAGRRTCLWVTDYAAHEFTAESLTPSAEQDCDRIALDFRGNGAEILYYSINGRRCVLSRDLTLDYTTLSFEADAFAYTTASASETLDAATAIVSAPAPLCNTTFRLSGDRFQREWRREVSIESPLVTATAIAVETTATQAERDNDNEIREEGGNLGGSGPAEITFAAAVSDAAIFTEWQISRSADFSTLENSYNQTTFDYTFSDQGTTYVRFTANNADGTCPFESETYEVFIGESKLEIPNAFSPGTSPGVNDEWKVSYKSIVSYECHIFNRWGKQLFSSTNPAEGWDGKVGNKYVPAGVYFYVINARGSDGVEYKRAGDINVIGYSTGSGTGTGDGGETTE